jgi:hypothetical protein
MLSYSCIFINFPVLTEFMFYKLKIALSFLLFSTMLEGQAQKVESRKYSNEFLAIGVGADALGMSNAAVAKVNDATSGYWNPAGLANLSSDYQVALMHSEYFAGIAKYDYAAFAMRIDQSSVLAVSAIRFGVDDIPNTTQLIDKEGNINYDRITSFSAADYGFLFSYARKAKIEGLNYGANVKIVHRIVGEFATAWGFGLDAGAQYQRNDWQFAVMSRDVTSTFNAWNFTNSQEFIDVLEATGNEIPENSIEVTLPKVIFGIGRNFKISQKFGLYTELDLDITTDGQRNVPINSDPFSIDPHLGLEVNYSKIAFLRGGIGNFQRSEDINGNRELLFQPNFGVGIRLKGVSVDYALTDIGDRSIAIYSNVFSLKIDINRSNE